MIELLVKYIQDRGYEVEVIPHVVHIWKKAKGERFGVSWAFPPVHLHPDFEQYLYHEASKRLELIEKAIAEYQGGAGDAGVDTSPGMG